MGLDFMEILRIITYLIKLCGYSTDTIILGEGMEMLSEANKKSKFNLCCQ